MRRRAIPPAALATSPTGVPRRPGAVTARWIAAGQMKASAGVAVHQGEAVACPASPSAHGSDQPSPKAPA